MKSLRKTLDVLEVFLTQEGGLALSDIANATKLNISTIHGIVSYLRKRGYLLQKEKRAKYTLGYKFLEFNDMVVRNVRIGDLADPLMKELNQLTHESVCIAILYGNIAEVIGIVESPHYLRVTGRSDREAPLYCSGVGKVLLAYESEEDQERYFSNITLTSLTPNTITDVSKLKEHLLDIRRQGYVIDNQEMVLGVISIAVPVRDRNGEVVAALGIVGPTVRVTDAKIGELIIAAKGCASEISRALGYKEMQ